MCEKVRHRDLHLSCSEDRAHYCSLASTTLTGHPALCTSVLQASILVALLACLDCIWWMDIFVTFRTAVRPRWSNQHGSNRQSGEEQLIVSPGKIFWVYVKGYLFLDLVSAMPYHLLLHWSNDFSATRLAGDSSYDDRVRKSLLSLLPLLTLLRLRRLYRTEHVRTYLLGDSASDQLARLALLFVYLAHLNGCIYWFLSVVELRLALAASRNSWGAAQDFLPPLQYISYLDEGWEELLQRNASGVEFDFELTRHTLVGSYLFAFVWGMLNVSGVNFTKPTNTLQAVNGLFVVCCAILTNAVIIGSVTTTLYRLNFARHTEEHKRQAIQAHLKLNGVPRHLQKRVQQFYNFMGGVGEATPTEQLLPALPKGLVFQLELLQKREVFTKVPFFTDLTHEQIIELVPRVKRMFAIPGRTLIREGRISAGLYMIARGRVRIECKGEFLNERILGEFVGERSLINTATAQATCITAEFCELFLLGRPDFLDLTKRYPELLGRITFYANRKDKASHQTAATKQRKLQEQQAKQKKKRVSIARGGTDTGGTDTRAEESMRRMRRMKQEDHGAVGEVLETLQGGVKAVVRKVRTNTATVPRRLNQFMADAEAEESSMVKL